MFNSNFITVSLFLSVLTVGCASRHESMKGSVAMKISDSKGIACLFGESPKVGAKLTLFENACAETGSEKRALNCKMIESGNATITKMINDHYAEFETQQNTPFQEGYMIKLSK